MKNPLQAVDYSFGYFALCLLGGIYFAEANTISAERWLVFASLSFISLAMVHILLTRVWIEQVYLRALFGLLIGFLFFSGGAWIYQSRTSANQLHHYSHFLSASTNQLLLQPVERWKPTAFGERYVAKVLSINGNRAEGKLLVQISNDENLTVSTDSVYAFAGDVQVPSSSKNPYQFDYRRFLNRKFIYHQIAPDSNLLIAVEGAKGGILKKIEHIRETGRQLIEKHFPNQDVSAIIQALLLGQRQEVSDELNAQYVKAGAIHLLAVSGLHVGIVALLLYLLTYPFLYWKKGKWLRFITVFLFLWGFAAIAGFSPSVTRAVFMFSIIGLALLWGRGMHGLSATFLSAFLLLLYNPSYAFEVGFQLSYLAVIGIFVIKPFFDRWWCPKNKLLNYVWTLLSVSLAAQLAVMPLSLYYFHQFPGLFALSGLVIIPVMGFILGGGFAVLASLYFFDGFGVLTDLYGQVIVWMNTFIGWVAERENYIFTDIPFDGVMLAAVYGVLIVWVLYGHRRSKRLLALLLVSLMVFQALLFYRKNTDKEAPRFWVYYQYKARVLGIQQSGKLQIFTDSVISPPAWLTNFIMEERLQRVEHAPLQKFFEIDGKIFMLLDHPFTEEITTSPYGLIISQNPQVNPRRVLNTIQPKVIIVDGSNYKSVSDDWQKEAEKQSIPFHPVYQNGFYCWPPLDN